MIEETTNVLGIANLVKKAIELGLSRNEVINLISEEYKNSEDKREGNGSLDERMEVRIIRFFKQKMDYLDFGYPMQKETIEKFLILTISKAYSLYSTKQKVSLKVIKKFIYKEIKVLTPQEIDELMKEMILKEENPSLQEIFETKNLPIIENKLKNFSGKEEKKIMRIVFLIKMARF